jgi:hypothetical protein
MRLAINPPGNFVQLVRASFSLCAARTPALASLHQALIFVSASALLPRAYAGSLAESLQPFLTAPAPSAYLGGLRMLAQAAATAPPRALSGLRPAADWLTGRFPVMSSFPIAAAAQSRALTAILRRPEAGPLHTQLLRQLPQPFIVAEDSPGFADSVTFWPAVADLIADRSELFDRVWRVCDGLTAMHGGFAAGLDCLREKLRFVAAAHRDVTVSEAVRGWIATFRKWRGHREAAEIGAWLDLVLDGVPETLPMVAFAIAMEVRPFWAVFAHFTRLWRSGRPEVREAVRSAALALDRECHRKAVALLDRGVDCCEVWALACFPDDCPDAEQLAATLEAKGG